MTELRLRGLTLVLAALASGCSWLNLRSNGDRNDPLVMSHLTHGKGNAAFAADANSAIDSPIQSASISQKLGATRSSTPYQHASLRETVPSDCAPAASTGKHWLQGRVSRQANGMGWRLRYAPSVSADRFGGEVRLKGSDRLALLREGDRVFVEGRLLDEADPVCFHVESLTVLPQ